MSDADASSGAAERSTRHRTELIDVEQLEVALSS